MPVIHCILIFGAKNGLKLRATYVSIAKLKTCWLWNVLDGDEGDEWQRTYDMIDVFGFTLYKWKVVKKGK